MPSFLPIRYYQCFDKHRQILYEVINSQTKLGKFSTVSLLFSSLMRPRVRFFDNKTCQIWSVHLSIYTKFVCAYQNNDNNI